MATTVDAVRAHLKRDPALAHVLVRGLVGWRRTARWLIAEHGWDTSEEAVVSALRRYARDHDATPLDGVEETLADARVDARGGLALLTVPRVYEMKKKLLEAWNAGRVRDMVAILPAQRELKLLIEASNVQHTRKKLGPHMVEDIQQPLTAITLTCHQEPPNGAIASLGLMALDLERIEVIDHLSAGNEYTFLIPDKQRMRAFDTLSELTGDALAP